MISYLNVILALVFVIGLIGLVAVLARKFNFYNCNPTPDIEGENKILRLQESIHLDPQRRIVLVRCGRRQHLMLLSPLRDIVIESYEPEGEGW